MKQLSLLNFARLRDPDVHHVAAVADEIVEELGLEPPIDPRIVASYLGVAAIEQSDLDVAGCLICSERGVLIKVRSADNPRRQRFSVFHECVHTWFPGYERRTQYRCDPDEIAADDRSLEALCDAGAGALLLPRRYFSADLRSSGFGVTTLDDLATKYEASLEATGHCMVELAPEPTLFVIMEVRTKPSERGDPLAEPRLRVRTARGTRGAWPYVMPHKSVSRDSPLERALQGELVNEIATLDEISVEPVDGVEVSAKVFPFDGRQRVLALYRKVA